MTHKHDHWIRLALIGIAVVTIVSGMARVPAYTVQAQSGGVLAYGSKVFGSVSADVPMVTYSFTGSPGDLVTVVADSWTGALDVQVDLVAPNGLQLSQSTQDMPGGDPMGAYLSVVLPDAGVYLLRVSGENGTIGDFLLALLGRGGASSTPLVYGQAVDVNVPENAQPQYYSFETEDCPTTLIVTNQSPGQPFTFPFVVKVRDQRGQNVALLRGGEQTEDWMTVAPRSGRYEVEVLSTDPALVGTVRLLVTCSGDNPGCPAGQAGIAGIPGPEECRACPSGDDLTGGGGCPDLNLRLQQGLHMSTATTVFWDPMPGADGYFVYVYGVSMHDGETAETYLTHAEWTPGDPFEFTWILPAEGYVAFRFELRVMMSEHVVCSQQAVWENEQPGECEDFGVSVRMIDSDAGLYEWSWTAYPGADGYVLSLFGTMPDGTEILLGTASLAPDTTNLPGGLAPGAPFVSLRLHVAVARDGWLICATDSILLLGELPTDELVCPDFWPMFATRVSDTTLTVEWGEIPGVVQYVFWVEDEGGTMLPGYPLLVGGTSVTLEENPDMFRSVVAIADPATGAIFCETAIVMARQQEEPMCVVVTDSSSVQVHVGPGLSRAVFEFMQAGVEYTVVGQAVDSEGNLWWQIDKTQFPGHEVVISLWVMQSDVTALGDGCPDVEFTEPPPIIPEDEGVPPGTWGPCGSCDTCGFPANECVTSPEGACLWDPATCRYEPPPPEEDGEECYRLSTAAEPSWAGSVSVLTGANCDGRYTAGTVVQVQAAVSDPKMHFDHWAGCGASGSANPVSITMTSSCTITAYFDS